MKYWASICVVIAVLCAVSCGWLEPQTLSAPASLAAVGSLGQIELSWSDVVFEGLGGYNVYRSTDGTAFSLLVHVEATTYTDTIASPDGDGILYSYRVTAVADKESDPSAAVQQMHGTRLPAVYNGAGDFQTNTGESPYVVEGECFIQKNLLVNDDTSLSILPGATLRMLRDTFITCYGTLQSLGTPTSPAAITCTQMDGSDPEGLSGVQIGFYSAPAWDPVTKKGTMLKYTRVTNSTNAITIQATKALMDNCYFASSPESLAMLMISGTPCPVVTHCQMTDVFLGITSDMRGSGFSFTNNRIRCMISPYIIQFYTLNNDQVLDPGQVSQNDMDGFRAIIIYNITKSVAIPLGDNFWNWGSGTPPTPGVVQDSGVNATIDFTTPLSSAPASAGPVW
jgi:hypothetical protein